MDQMRVGPTTLYDPTASIDSIPKRKPGKASKRKISEERLPSDESDLIRR